MVGRGRRPGGADTRAEIVEAARIAFAEDGYAKTSIRSIARQAKVDPALVHHYFADKAALFAETMELPADPKVIAAEVTTGPFSGERLVERFLSQWEREGGTGSSSFPDSRRRWQPPPRLPPTCVSSSSSASVSMAWPVTQRTSSPGGAR